MALGNTPSYPGFWVSTILWVESHTPNKADRARWVKPIELAAYERLSSFDVKAKRTC